MPSVLVLCGCSGCGKSTLVEILAEVYCLSSFGGICVTAFVTFTLYRSVALLFLSNSLCYLVNILGSRHTDRGVE